MQKWEIKVLGDLKRSQLDTDLPQLGLDGWEPVSVTANGGWFAVVMKRPLVEERQTVVEEPPAPEQPVSKAQARRRRIQEG